MPPEWTDDLSNHSSEEIFRAQRENREWYKEIRIRINFLIDSKLAKRIDSDEYSVGRKVSGEAVAECTRRLQMLRDELADRRRK